MNQLKTLPWTVAAMIACGVAASCVDEERIDIYDPVGNFDIPDS